MKNSILIATLFTLLLILSNQISCSNDKKSSYLPSAQTREKIANVSYAVASTIVNAGYKGFQLAMGKNKQSLEDSSHYGHSKNQKTRRKFSTRHEYEAKSNDGSLSGSDYSSDDESDDERSGFLVVGAEKSYKKLFFRNKEELQKSLDGNPTQTLYKLNQAVEDCFTRENPESLETQAEMSHMFSLTQQATHKTGQPFALDRIIAGTYRQEQSSIFVRALEAQAHDIEPEITKAHCDATKKAKEKCEQEIARAQAQCALKKEAADKKRDEKLINLCSQLGTIAGNTNYLIQCAREQDEVDQRLRPTNFSSLSNYQALLAQIRETNASTKK